MASVFRRFRREGSVIAMANSGKSKLKLLHLLRMLQEETDAEHGLSMTAILERLAEAGINAERKSIYDDISTLREFGVEIRTYQRNPVEYAIERRDFSLDELMLMADAIQSCRAITDHQAKLLIGKIKALSPEREREKLNRRIHVVGRVKSANKSVLKTVDILHEALRLRRKVEFSYTKLGSDGKRHVTREGRNHVVTPVGITYDDGFYYLTAWDDDHESMPEYRLDRVKSLKVLEEGATKNEQIANHAFGAGDTAVFGRFTENKGTAVLVAAPEKLEIITDRFGPAVTTIVADGDEARVSVRLCVSEQFFGWVAGTGKAVRIAEPPALVRKYEDFLRGLLES